ncbi:DTW domain-containing protein 1 [Mortierella alpina]|nr:DTW domain-containing protein 1 [Mortierella alpina]
MASTPSCHKKYTSPFAQFNISSTDVLDTIEKKHCPTCNKNVRYFCNKCLHLVNCPEGAVPQLKLPIKLDIIKHEQERDGKSTALHAKILAPQDVEVYAFKEMPKYENVDRLLLLFPCPEAKQLSEIDPTSFDKLVVIDGTWEQASKMAKSDSPLLRMKRVTIAPHETLFWRHQRKASDHLATIEAIYYFLREYHETYLSTPPAVDPSSKPVVDSVSTRPDGVSATKGSVLSSTDHVTEPLTSSATATPPSSDQGQQQQDSSSRTMSQMVVTPHREWIDSHQLGPYTNQFDDMLWFYKYFYELIQKTYRERTDGREFTLKHKKGYIQYHVEDEQKDEPSQAQGSEDRAVSLSAVAEDETAPAGVAVAAATATATAATAEPASSEVDTMSSSSS